MADDPMPGDPMTDRTHYEVIGVDPRASKADVKAAYAASLEVAQAADDADEVAAVRRAWQVLSDPVQRQRYDDEIGVTGRRGTGEPSVGLVAADAEVVDEVGEGLAGEGSAVEEGSAPLDREALFHHVPSFLEQPTIGRRLTASLIDVITTLALFLAGVTVTFQITGANSGLPVYFTLVGWAEFLLVVLYLLPTARAGQTLGKRFTYVMTVDRETGHLPSIGQVVRRYMIPMVAMAALLQMGAFLSLFFALSYAMAKDQLSLADRIAKTVVVVARYRPTRKGAPA